MKCMRELESNSEEMETAASSPRRDGSGSLLSARTVERRKPTAGAAASPSELILPQATGLKRILLVNLGFLNVGLAYIGWLLPGLPMTPFVLMASYCFARSNPKLHRWLLRSPFFGKLILDWHHHRGMRSRVKLTAVMMLIAACSFSILFTSVPDWVKYCIGLSGTLGFCVILFVVPTIREE